MGLARRVVACCDKLGVPLPAQTRAPGCLLAAPSPTDVAAIASAQEMNPSSKKAPVSKKKIYQLYVPFGTRQVQGSYARRRPV
jgi:hypothetical protein